MSLPTTPPRVMRGANGSVAGASGYPPIPAAADNVKYLKGDGTWSALSNASAATNAEAAAGTSTTTFVTPANAGIAAAGARNALATRGGVAFDGTPGTRATAILTGQVLGTDPHSVAVTFEVPSSNPSAYRGIFIVSSDPASWVVPNAWQVGISSAGVLTVEKRNAASSNGRSLSVAGFVASYGGKIVNMVLVRNGSATPTIYVNGVSQTVSLAGDATVDWGSTTPSTYLTLGIIQSGGEFVGKIYSATLYNLALTQADVTEIYELGGAVPERFKFGTQVPAYSSGFSADTDGWVNGGNVTTLTGNIDSIGGRDDNLRASGARPTVQRNGTIAARAGKAFRWSGSIYRPAAVGGTSVDLIDSDNSALANTGTLTADAWTDFSTTGLLKTGPGSGNMVMLSSAGSSPAADLYFRAIKFYQVGAVVHLPLNDNAGLIAYDSSTNALNATITATGVTWVLPPSKVVQVVDGTAAAPSISFASTPTTGFYKDSNGFGFARNGMRSFSIGGNGALYGAHSDAQYVYMPSSGAVSLVAAGTNQNITLTPSTTGTVDISSSNDASFGNVLRVLTPTLTSGNSALILLGKAGAANQSAFINYFYSSTAALGRLDFGHNGTTGQVSLLQTGRFLIGTGGTDSGALLQLGANAAGGYATAGMSFGGDVYLYRATAGALTFLGASLQPANGSAAAPPYSFINGSNYGMFISGSGLQFAANGVAALTLDGAQGAAFAAGITTGGSIVCAAGGTVQWNGRSAMGAPSDGVIRLTNNAGSDFTRLQFGGTTNAFPALARSGTNLLVVDATGGSYTPILASNFWATGSAVTVSAGNVSYGGSTSTTVGAAGGASALPATPTGYIIINVAGTPAKLPYYAA